MSRATVSILIAGMVLAAVQTPAQTTAPRPTLSFTATTDHVGGAPDSIRINLTRWSTDAERDQLLAAWNLTGLPPTGGRGAGRGARARGGGDPALEDDDPALAGASPGAGGGWRRWSWRPGWGWNCARRRGIGGGASNAGEFLGGGACPGAFGGISVVFGSRRICFALCRPAATAGRRASHPDHRSAFGRMERIVETGWIDRKQCRGDKLRVFRR